MIDQSSQATTEQLAEANFSPPAAPGHDAVIGDATPATAAAGSGLLGDNNGFEQRWNEIQATFVDEPRQAVERADTLVADVVERLARVFADERGRLEAAWSGGDTVSTEDLRQALQRYRDFFHALLRS